MSLNLASQPFVNSRPVRRLVFVLWCLSALLVVANLVFYTRHFSGQQTRRDRLAELTDQERRERETLGELERELAGYDIDWQNRQVEFLNLRIAERVFPWSRLFDRLTEALPRQVRLTSLRPQIEARGGAEAEGEESVRLEIRAQARREEAILVFVAQLFEHDAFREPNLASETRRPRSDVTEFALTVTYLPARAVEPGAGDARPAGAAAAPAAAVETEGGE